MIELLSVRKEFNDVTPLENINAVINDGDIISVIGPSGVGKSTLLRCINMLERPTSGRILVNGEDITAPKCDLKKIRRKMGMVFQQFNLFGHLRVIENIMLPQIDLLGRDRQEAYDVGMQKLAEVGLIEKALNYPDEISGGQKQRAAIARTLALDPDTILFDEPTSALDPTMIGEVQSVIKSLAGTGKTMVIVTHEMNFARAIANRVFYLDNGVIYEEGTPDEIFDHPQKDRTRRFIRRLKALEIEINNKIYDYHAHISAIDEFCSRNRISYRMSNHLELIFEELVCQVIMSSTDDPDIKCIVEFSEEQDGLSFAVSYNGEERDLTQKGDPLPLSVLKTAAKDIVYERLNDATRPNTIRLTVLP